MKKEEQKKYQEAGVLILIGSLVIIALSVAMLLLSLFDTTGKDYTTNITIVIPFIAICIAFIAWKSYFFPKKDSEKKGKDEEKK